MIAPETVIGAVRHNTTVSSFTAALRKLRVDEQLEKTLKKFLKDGT